MGNTTKSNSYLIKNKSHNLLYPELLLKTTLMVRYGTYTLFIRCSSHQPDLYLNNEYIRIGFSTVHKDYLGNNDF